MSDSKYPSSFRSAVTQGCVLGLVMAVLWAGLTIAIYLLITALGGSLGLAVVCGVGGGPLIGSALVLWWWWRRYGIHNIALVPKKAEEESEDSGL